MRRPRCCQLSPTNRERRKVRSKSTTIDLLRCTVRLDSFPLPVRPRPGGQFPFSRSVRRTAIPLGVATSLSLRLLRASGFDLASTLPLRRSLHLPQASGFGLASTLPLRRSLHLPQGQWLGDLASTLPLGDATFPTATSGIGLASTLPLGASPTVGMGTRSADSPVPALPLSQTRLPRE